MSVLLPANAKYVLFSDNKTDFHHEWDFTWSFTYKLETEKVVNEQYAFCTFLSKKKNINSLLLGQYMGFFDPLPDLLTEDSIEILTEDDEILELEDVVLNGGVAIAFDSTGLFALSSEKHPNGVGLDGIVKNSLIIRDSTGVIYNQPLSSFNGFKIDSDDKQTLRFRYINKNEISVDFKKGVDLYETMIRLPIQTNFGNSDKIYPNFFYTCPVSSNDMTNTTFYLENFHVQGNTNEPTYTT